MRKEGQSRPKKPVYKRVWFWVLVVVVAFFVAVMAMPMPEDSGTGQEEPSTATTEQEQQDTEEPAEEETPAVDAPDVAKDLDSKYCTYVRMSNNCLKGVLNEDNDPATTYTKCTQSRDFLCRRKRKSAQPVPTPTRTWLTVQRPLYSACIPHVETSRNTWTTGKPRT